MKKIKPMPKFLNEIEKRHFWEQHDSSEYIDWKQAQQVVILKLKSSTNIISLRLPQYLLDSTKVANARDVPCQSLIKMWLQEKPYDH